MMRKRAGRNAGHRDLRDARRRIANEAVTVAVAAGCGAGVSDTSAPSPARANAAGQQDIELPRSQFYWGPP
jgi:hypothetical protein